MKNCDNGCKTDEEENFELAIHSKRHYIYIVEESNPTNNSFCGILGILAMNAANIKGQKYTQGHQKDKIKLPQNIDTRCDWIL